MVHNRTNHNAGLCQIRVIHKMSLKAQFLSWIAVPCLVLVLRRLAALYYGLQMLTTKPKNAETHQRSDAIASEVASRIRVWVAVFDVMLLQEIQHAG